MRLPSILFSNWSSAAKAAALAIALGGAAMVYFSLTHNRSEATLTQVVTDAVEVDFETIARTPERFANKPVLIRDARVFEVTENGTQVDLRANMTKSEAGQWSDTVAVSFKRNAPHQGRILTSDIVEIYGVYLGLTGPNGLPHVRAVVVNLRGRQ